MKIELQRILQKKVSSYLVRQKLLDVAAFAGIRPLCCGHPNDEAYRRHFYKFMVKAPVQQVWETYSQIGPGEAWNGKMVSFGLQYSSLRQKVFYPGDACGGMEKGQVMVLNLKLLWGLVQIAVAHQVAEVNEQSYSIKLCYVAGGASEGSQWIYLKSAGEGLTEVSHLTRYKSKSAFRDKVLYPPLHTRAIREFHENIRNRAEQKPG